MATVRDLYEILGIGRDASTEDIRTAYRRLAREFHPDVNDDPEAEQRFKEVAGGYWPFRSVPSTMRTSTTTPR